MAKNLLPFNQKVKESKNRVGKRAITQLKPATAETLYALEGSPDIFLAVMLGVLKRRRENDGWRKNIGS
jgi:hypothetical protein